MNSDWDVLEDIFNLDPNETSWFVVNRLIDLLGREINETRIHAERYHFLKKMLNKLHGKEYDDEAISHIFYYWYFERQKLSKQVKGLKHMEIFIEELKGVFEEPETDLERKFYEEAKRKIESGVGSVPEEDSRDVKRKKRRKASGAEGQEDTV